MAEELFQTEVKVTKPPIFTSEPLSRRDFLKLASASLAAAALPIKPNTTQETANHPAVTSPSNRGFFDRLLAFLENSDSGNDKNLNLYIPKDPELNRSADALYLKLGKDAHFEVYVGADLKETENTLHAIFDLEPNPYMVGKKIRAEEKSKNFFI